MDPSRRLSEIGLGQNSSEVADNTEYDHLQELENRDENVCHDNNNPNHDEEGKGKSKNSNTNKRVSISLACLEALQQVR